MLQVLAVTAPIYLIIAVGWLAVRSGWVARPDTGAVGRYVAQIAVPALLFRSVHRLPIHEVLHLDYLAVYAVGALLALLIPLAVAWKLRARPLTLAAVIALGASSSNSAFVGYPILAQLLGPVAGVALAMCMLVENLLIIPLALALAEAGSRDAHPWRQLQQALAGLARNPMIIAIVVGLAVSLSGVAMPAVLTRTVELVAASAAPAALFVIGGTLVGLKLAGLKGDIALVVAGKLLLHPALVAALLWAWPVAGPGLAAAALLFAAMPMLSIYPVLAQRHGHEQVSAAALLAATVASFITLNALIAALPAGWLPAR